MSNNKLFDEYANECEMFLQSDNGGNGILVTDGWGNWFYWHESELPITLDADTAEENAERIRAAVKSFELYDAADFVNECNNPAIYAAHAVEEYDGLLDIEALEAYENAGRTIDTTKYIAI